MAIENISQDIADLLATKDFDVKYTDGQGQDSSPDEAKTFAFDWVAGSGQNYGTVVIVIGDDNDLQLFFGDNLGKTMENPQDKLDWFGSERETGFLPELKNFATQHRYTFSPKDINQLKHTMQGMAAIKEGLFEGYYGTRKISYVGEQTEARLVIKHNRMIGEDDKRYRYVESLFIETVDGERFKLPFVKLSGGRAMLEHVKQGGRPYDIRGQHINEIVTEMAVLSRFNRASQQRVFEGVTQELVETVQHYYSELRGNLQHMATGRGYTQYFESWTPADIGDETALVEDLKTMFIEQTLDARIEAALPTLAKIQQRGNAMKEAQIFENWVNGIMEGTWALPDTPEAQAKLDELMSQELIVGPDATNAKEQLYDVIGDDKLFDILADLAEQDPRANCWDDTDVQARLQELGIQMNTTPDAEQQQPVAPPAGEQAPGTAPEQGVAEGQLDSVRDKLGNQGYISTQQDRLQNMQQYQDEKAARHQSNLRRRDNYDRFHDAQTQHDIDVMAHSLGRMSKNDDDWEKTFDMMRDRINRFQSSTQSGVDPEQLKKITNIKYKPNKKPSNQSVAEGLGSGVDAKGRTQQQWIRLVKAKYPDARIMQSKMIDGPCQAILSNGQKLSWNKIEQAVAEDQLDELSPTTLSSYARKAKGQAGWAAGVATRAPGYKDQLTRGGEVVRQQHIVPGSEADQYDKLAKRRYAGARQAVGKGANVNPGNVEPYDWAKQGGYGDATNPAMRKRGMAEDQLDELSPSTLSNYVNKAVDDVADRSNSTGFQKGARVAFNAVAGGLPKSGRFEKDSKIANRKVGISRAIGRMEENTELSTMLKYAGVPVNESRIHENSEYTYEKVAKILARENPGLSTDRNSDEFYSAVYHELIAIGMTPKAARNLISYNEDFMSDVASAYDHYQKNPGLDESNSGMIMPEADPMATVEAMPDLSAPVVEGSCNTTMEGEYCPEHGLTECGMYEMGTVAGSMAPVIGEAPQDPINYNAAITGAYYESKSDTALLARIKSLALLR